MDIIESIKTAANDIVGSVSKSNKAKDARTILQTLLVGDDAVAKNNSKDIITLANLHMVAGMPPMGDNIVDPPPFLNTSSSTNDKVYGIGRSYSSAFSTGLAGMDYVERCIVGGNFLILVPLEMKPDLLGNITSGGAIAPNALGTLSGRLGVASYGLDVSVASRRYWRSYTLLAKTAAMALGVDIESGTYTADALSELLPKYIFDHLINKSSESTMFKFTDGAAGNDTETTKDRTGLQDISKKFNKMLERQEKTAGKYVQDLQSMNKGAGITSTAEEVGAKDLNAIVSGASYINLMKYMTNVDDSVTANTRLPMISFFLNGPIERNFSTTASIDESKVARASTDMLRKGMANDQETSDYITEMAYHGKGGATASFALSNTSIPKVISDTASDFSFSAKISEKVTGSDPCSLFRVSNTLALIQPFITPVSDGRQNTVVPNAPLYCAAFVKGVMNVPRAAITSASIVTNPQYQTSEGIPTEIDITITIQPLLCISTMPDFGRFFTRTDDAALVAAMFNPMSAFNIIATLCGYNTVLTKYPESLFAFFIGGRVTSMVNSLKGIANYYHTAGNDFLATRALSVGSTFIVP